MKVRVVCFGALREMAAPEFVLEMPEGATAGDAWQQVRSQHPALARFDRSIAIAVNQNFAVTSTRLQQNDEIALLPPVSGGAPQDELPLTSEHGRIQRETLDAAALLAEVKHGADGAVTLFDGIVRNETRGRRTLYLEYEAYPAMAIAEMEKLAKQALERFAIRDVRIVHRVGHLDIGESSVLIAVASAHRAASFDACRWIIDTLKKTVPIWKKEFFEDGAVWADGDPFPPDVETVG